MGSQLALLPQSWHRQSTSLRFVGLRGLRPVPGLRPLRHTISRFGGDLTQITARPSEFTHERGNSRTASPVPLRSGENSVCPVRFEWPYGGFDYRSCNEN